MKSFLLAAFLLYVGSSGPMFAAYTRGAITAKTYFRIYTPAIKIFPPTAFNHYVNWWDKHFGGNGVPQSTFE